MRPRGEGRPSSPGWATEVCVKRARCGWLVVAGAVLVLAGCGVQTPDEIAAQTGGTPSPSADPQRARITPPKDGDLCAALVEQNAPDVRNDDGRPGELVLNKRSTTAGVERWMAERFADGGPVVTLADFENRGLDAGAEPAEAFSVCVFKVDPRSISTPPGVNNVANGVSVFVQGTGAYVVDAIGSVASLVAQVEKL